MPWSVCVALGRSDLGHLDSFQSSNLDVAHDARTLFFGQTEAEIRASRSWRQRVRVRLLPLEQLDAAARAEFRARMDRELPRR